MRVLGVGYCTLDQISVVERLADVDAAVEMSKFSVQGGGTAATAMTVLSRWGVETSFVGKVGNDERGRKIERTLSNEGVNTRALVRQDGAISQLSFILVEANSGRKTTYYTPGSVSELGVDEVDPALLDGVSILLVDGVYPAAQSVLMRAARERKIPVVLKTGGRSSKAAELVEFCDYLITTERFASRLTGMGQLPELCGALLKRGPHTVVVTLGDEGCVAMARGDDTMLRESAFDVEVVDDTGSGAVFLGAFAYGILQGWGLGKKVAVANVAAGLSCQDVGARSVQVSVADVLRELPRG